MTKFTGHIECAARLNRETRTIGEAITDRIIRVNLHARLADHDEVQAYVDARPKAIGFTVDRFNPIIMFNLSVKRDDNDVVSKTTIKRIQLFLKHCEVDDQSPEFNRYGLAVASLDDLKKFVNF